jgi:hypothetical protein
VNGCADPRITLDLCTHFSYLSDSVPVYLLFKKLNTSQNTLCSLNIKTNGCQW